MEFYERKGIGRGRKGEIEREREGEIDREREGESVTGTVIIPENKEKNREHEH